MILMLKDTEVYDISNNVILSDRLFPKLIRKIGFMEWLKIRYSAESNTEYRRLRHKLFYNTTREQINKSTYSVFLSDCYWIKDKDSNTKFDDISPYSDFSNYPNLFVQGYKPKRWLNSTYLYKENSIEDYYAMEYCNVLGIKCQEVQKYFSKHVLIRNFTNEDKMLIQANQDIRIDANNWMEKDIIDKYGEFNQVSHMFLIDSLLYNTDRHLGNFGLLVSTNTGDVVDFAPLYDFDRDFDLIQEDTYDITMEIIKEFRNKDELKYMCKKLIESSTDLYKKDIIMERAKNIINVL